MKDDSSKGVTKRTRVKRAKDAGVTGYKPKNTWIDHFKGSGAEKAFEYLKTVKSRDRMNEIKGILIHYEEMSEQLDTVLIENKHLKKTLDELKKDLYVTKEEVNKELSERLNANKNEKYWFKKSEQLSKALLRANKTNKKMFKLLHNISNLTNIYKNFKIWDKT